jgi:splicing factor 1
MEGDSGAKIAIRGKGSVKEGKGRSDAAHASNQEEDLHCLIMADTEEKVNKAKKLIHNVIETVSQLSKLYQAFTDTSQAASIPEGQNELKRNQLRELAALNGTLRDDENQACQNCGKIGHRKYDCPEKQNFTASIICRVCGNAGHMARDCPDRQRGASWRNNDAGGRPAAAGRIDSGDAVDREYEVRNPLFVLNTKYSQILATYARAWWRFFRTPCPYRGRPWRSEQRRCEALATRSDRWTCALAQP